MTSLFRGALDIKSNALNRVAENVPGGAIGVFAGKDKKRGSGKERGTLAGGDAIRSAIGAGGLLGEIKRRF